MVIFLLLGAAIGTTHYKLIDASNEAEELNVSLPRTYTPRVTRLSRKSPLFSPFRYSFSDVKEIPTKELRPTSNPQQESKQSLQASPKPKDWNLEVNKKSTSRNSSERFRRRILFQTDTDIDLANRQTDQIFNNVESGTRPRRQVCRNFTIANSTWKDGIFYTFNTSDSEVQALFKKGAKIWSENTCIDFIEDKDAQDKVVVIAGESSWSDIGQTGGDQLLSVAEDCLTERSALHEIGHVLGLFHTMQRYDRDNFIRILMQNIDSRYLDVLTIAHPIYADVYGLAYDYGSIMHYGELCFSTNSRPTMIAVDPRYQKTMGSEMVSFSDIFMVNEHHGCNAKCNKIISAKCANEGYPHPRNCSICICPGGYGGDLCDQRPPGCGENLAATRRKKALTYTLGSGYDIMDEFDFCNYMITAPEGKKIEVNVQSISHGYELPGCALGGVEVKAQEDQRLTGYRFCSVNGSGGPIVSVLNRLPVILFRRVGSLKIKLTFRSVD